jgi:hypothetical protein
MHQKNMHRIVQNTFFLITILTILLYIFRMNNLQTYGRTITLLHRRKTMRRSIDDLIAMLNNTLDNNTYLQLTEYLPLLQALATAHVAKQTERVADRLSLGSITVTF